MSTEYSNMKKYLKSCKSDFWKAVFQAELDYIMHKLKGAKDVLSVGCGPAIIETDLAKQGINITGLDISREALGHASDNIRAVIGRAEIMEFEDCSFDAAVYVVSLQFIQKYKQAIKETARVLRSQGKLLVMLLNPQSEFFKGKIKNPDSYINKIKHIDLEKIEKAVSEFFSIKTEYFLGIKDTGIFQSRDPNLASLYIIKGIKRQYG
jgi:ubiquinone/menaquinone biosynthesis C-methylase UbiE